MKYSEEWDRSVKTWGVRGKGAGKGYDEQLYDTPFLSLPRDSKVLDVGCGIGRLMHFFKNSQGIDVSMEMLKHNPFYPKQAKHGSATELPFKDKSFEYSFASVVLGHLETEDMIKAIKEMVRVTQKKVIFNLPYKYTFQNLFWYIKSIYWKIMKKYPLHTARNYSKTGIQKILNSIGVKTSSIFLIKERVYVIIDLEATAK